MNFKTAAAVTLAALMAFTPAGAKSFKRGVSENQFALHNQMVILEPGVSWYYNWANTPGKGYRNEVINFDGFDFIPMVWNGNYNPDAIREYCAAHPNVKYLLGFNEPNFKAQSNMTPTAAAQLWPAVQALAEELGLELVAPAMNYSPDAPYQSPTKWFDEFVALVGKDAFDYVAVHNYGGLGVMKTLAGQFHERYGKDVWVTEFCLWPNEGQQSSSVAPETQIASMVETVEWLEQTPWIHRYAWFKAVGKHTTSASSPSPSYGLIITENGVGEKHLSPQGYVYVYMSDFNPDVWHTVGEEIPATEYMARTSASLAPGNREGAPKPIEISAFNAGATLDYRIEVAEAGVYDLTLTVTGQGEPVRFDPSVKVLLVEGDNTTEICPATSFTLPGNDTEYVERKLAVNLPAGRSTIRLSDANPYQPSGIRISSLRLTGSAGVDDIVIGSEEPDGPTYTVDGRRVVPGALAPGIYIRNGKKFIFH